MRAAPGAFDDLVGTGTGTTARWSVGAPGRPHHLDRSETGTMTSSLDLGSAHVFVTGGTGFVGQAVIERLLSAHPGTRISMLVRPKTGQTTEDRLRTLLRKPVFKTWRSEIGADAVEEQVGRRVTIVEGGLTSIPPLPSDIDVVIHSASTVSFDPPIDQAFDTNVGGALGLYEALLASGADPHVVHVSTCYVGGIRKGVLPEARLEHDVDWRAEYAAAKAAREQVELASREPQTLSRLMAESRARHSKEGPQTVARATEAARVAWVTSQLVDAGRRRAESLGWTDVYTLTKAFAERAAETLWAERGHRLSIVRPSIIESALQHPYPGWIDGFKVAEPLILAFGRGQLTDFPGNPDSILDVIPVDFVVNAALAVAANPPVPSGPANYYQVASGATNPLPLHAMYENVRQYFTEHPMPAPYSTDAARVPTWRFPGEGRLEKALSSAERRADLTDRLLLMLPSNERTRRWQTMSSRGRSELEVLRTLSDLYRAYVKTEIVFDDTRLRELHAGLPTELQDSRGFDVSRIDWTDYFQRVHFPTVTKLTRAFAGRSGASGGSESREARALETRTDVVAIFDLEGTVVDSNIVEQYLWVRSSGFGKAAWPKEVADLLTSLPRYLAAERRDRGEFIRTFLRRYAGMPAERLERIVQRGYKDTLLRHTSAAAIERIKQHRAAGHRTILVTGSIGTLVAPLAGLFDEVVASEMHVRDGVLTGFLAKPPLVDEARAAWLRQYADRHGIDLSASYGYGDSHSDLVWLGLLGHPSAVNPDPQLAREAQRKQWEINTWKGGGRTTL